MTMDTEPRVVFADAARKISITTLEVDLAGTKYPVSEILDANIGSRIERLSGCAPIVWGGATVILLLGVTISIIAVLGVCLCGYLTYASLTQKPTTVYFVEVTTSSGTVVGYETDDMALAEAVSQAIQDARMWRIRDVG